MREIMKKIVAMLMALTMCLAVLTACGSDAASAGAGSDAAGSDAGSSQGSVEAAGDSGASGGREVLVVGTNAEFPPFEYVGDDGEPDGFDVALIKAIADRMDMDVEMQNMEFDSLVASIGSKIDVAIAGMTITEERQQSVDFSDEYYEAIQYVVVPKGAQFSTMADLENKKIGVQLGTTGNTIADEITGSTVQTYNKAVDAVNDLINGRVELVIIDKNPAEVFAAQFSDKVDIIDGAQFDFEPEYYAIALPKGSELVEKVNAALAELKADGTFDALVAEYIQ